MPDIIVIPSLARLAVEQEVLPWAHRLINDLHLQLMAIADAINTLNASMGGGGGPAHALLSPTHTDVVPSPPVRGSLIVGNSTPEWQRLPLGSAARFLRSNGTDPVWAFIGKPDLPAAIAYEDESNTFTLAQIFQSYLEQVSIATPANPPPGAIRFYSNKTGSVVEVRIRFEDGSECVVCTHNLTVTADSLPLNWVE